MPAALTGNGPSSGLPWGLRGELASSEKALETTEPSHSQNLSWRCFQGPRCPKSKTAAAICDRTLKLGLEDKGGTEAKVSMQREKEVKYPSYFQVIAMYSPMGP